MADPTNAQIAPALDELGDLYELDGAVSYRVIAYRNAAKAVRESSVSIIALTREGKVTTVPGIGKTLEEKLLALDETGDIPSAVKLRAKFPAGLVEMTKLPGYGAKRARQLNDGASDNSSAGPSLKKCAPTRTGVVLSDCCCRTRACSGRISVSWLTVSAKAKSQAVDSLRPSSARLRWPVYRQAAMTMHK
jgi:hypothetical protein